MAATAKVPAPSASAAQPSPELPAATTHELTQLLDARVLFLARGEKGRLAVLTDEGGVVVPQRYEHGAWERLPIPEEHRATTEAARLGMYFGRDDRPRLMGYRLVGGEPRMVYLRYRDGRWHDQRREVGSLAGDDAALFGELGEADPEIVCRAENSCILKSRRGWQVHRSALPLESVTRAFSGRGYAALATGLFRGENLGFERLGGETPWKAVPSGFWIGPDGDAAVVDRGSERLFTRGPGATAWLTQPSPIHGPRDVAGGRAERFVVGDGGVAVLGQDGARRLGAPSLALSRVIVIDDHVVTAGPSGVFRIRRR